VSGNLCGFSDTRRLPQQLFSELFFDAVNGLIEFDIFLRVFEEIDLVIARDQMRKPNAQ